MFINFIDNLVYIRERVLISLKRPQASDYDAKLRTIKIIIKVIWHRWHMSLNGIYSKPLEKNQNQSSLQEFSV